ncbi:hypothetical protein LGK95_12580 [Clostridium algoriphilum]|uniref:hypothetical protein n=1 Tax=Clostridium algoriphilum TaxID=198347 RepID=UPI001CF5A4E2|nr:hypothetical protein [Clostridium algoriphilum]MCB2294345.1 hypothetical protein [Clostridium algoriphilum]
MIFTFVVKDSEVCPNAVSSYWVINNGYLHVISGSVLNNQTATCWVCIDPNEHYVYRILFNSPDDLFNSKTICDHKLFMTPGGIWEAKANLLFL